MRADKGVVHLLLRHGGQPRREGEAGSVDLPQIRYSQTVAHYNFNIIIKGVAAAMVVFYNVTKPTLTQQVFEGEALKYYKFHRNLYRSFTTILLFNTFWTFTQVWIFQDCRLVGLNWSLLFINRSAWCLC